MDHVDRRARRHRRRQPRAAADVGRVTVTADLAPGEPLRIVKFLAYGWSAGARCRRSRDQVIGALCRGAAHRLGRPAGRAARLPRRLLGARRRRARRRRRAAAGGPLRPVPHACRRAPAGRAAGDPRQGADRTRLRRPHLLGHRDASCCRCSPTRRPTPRPTRCAGATRRSTWPASGRASSGLAGAAFPWRTIRGQECSGYWPAGTAGLPHQRRHRRRGRRATCTATGDDGLRARGRASSCWSRRRGCGARSATTTPHGPLPDRRRHRPRRVQRDRRQQRLHQPDGAAEPARRRRRGRSGTATGAAELGVDDEEAAAWRDAAEAMVVPYDEALGVHPQAEGFTEHERLGLRRHAAGAATRCCSTTPTSTCTASRSSSRPTWCWRCTCAATPSPPRRRPRNFAYYEALTVRDSSLSACTQAVIAAEVGHLELAYDYFGEAALMDLDDLEHNTRDGLHIASLAGAWIAAVAGFGGMRDHDGELQLRTAPPAPPEEARLSPDVPRTTPRRRGPQAGRRLHPARRPAARGEPPWQADHGLERGTGDRGDSAVRAATGAEPARRPRAGSLHPARAAVARPGLACVGSRLTATRSRRYNVGRTPPCGRR